MTEDQCKSYFNFLPQFYLLNQKKVEIVWELLILGIKKLIRALDYISFEVRLCIFFIFLD